VETYYARIDLDGNKIYNETETVSDTLTVQCYAKGQTGCDYGQCCAGLSCSKTGGVGICQYPSGGGGGCGRNCLFK